MRLRVLLLAVVVIRFALGLYVLPPRVKLVCGAFIIASAATLVHLPFKKFPIPIVNIIVGVQVLCVCCHALIIGLEKLGLQNEKPGETRNVYS